MCLYNLIQVTGGWILATTSKFKKSPAPNILDFLKGLTAWICTTNPSQDSLLKLLTKYPTIDIGFIFNRLMSYNTSLPHLIWYCNKYLNNFYEFSSLKSNKQLHFENKVRLINTFKHLMDINFQSNRSKLHYLKSNELKDENRRQIKKLLTNYFLEIYDKTYNDKELDQFYYLFERGIIIEEDLYKADELINNGKRTLKLNLTTTGFDTFDIPTQNEFMTPQQYLEHCRKRELSPTIQAYCKSLIDIKQPRDLCQTCALYNKPMIVLDTNMENFGPIDVMFVGLNPGKDEVIFNKTFIGSPSIILREKIMKFHPNTKWVITNIIMCHTPNEKDLNDWEKVAKDCASTFLMDLTQKFPPKVFVTIGRQSKEFFRVKDMISKCSGLVYDYGNYKIIPLIHPSSVARSREKNAAIFDNSWKNIYANVENPVVNIPCETVAVEQTVQTPSQTQCSTYLKEEDMIKEVTPDLMLFDIVNLDNERVLKIFINPQGKKKYQIVNYVVPMYVKYSNNWRQNETLTNQVNAVVYVPGKNRYYVNTTLKDNLEKIKMI
jgi:uracil-DNA glycosylase family 4